MVYHSPTHLLDPTTIPQQPQELIQEWTLRNLSLATTTIEDTIKFLVKHKLLANCSTCTACNRLRTIHQDHTKTDSIIWDCPNCRCRSKKSIREGSFFSGSQLSLVKLLTFIYRWTEEYPLFCCSRESGGMAENTQTHWGLMCRGVCEDWLIQHSTEIGMCNIVQFAPGYVYVSECESNSTQSSDDRRGRVMDEDEDAHDLTHVHIATCYSM